MNLKPESLYRTAKGNIIKYSFPLKDSSGQFKYMFWDMTKNCTVVFTEYELPGLIYDPALDALYD